VELIHPDVDTGTPANNRPDHAPQRERGMGTCCLSYSLNVTVDRNIGSYVHPDSGWYERELTNRIGHI
jgi:hypothetical protein